MATQPFGELPKSVSREKEIAEAWQKLQTDEFMADSDFESQAVLQFRDGQISSEADLRDLYDKLNPPPSPTDIAAKQAIAPKREAAAPGKREIHEPTVLEKRQLATADMGKTEIVLPPQSAQRQITKPPEGGMSATSLGDTQLPMATILEDEKSSAKTRLDPKADWSLSDSLMPSGHTKITPAPSDSSKLTEPLGGGEQELPQGAANVLQGNEEKPSARERPKITAPPKSNFQDRLLRHVASAGLSSGLGQLNLPLGLGDFAHQELMGMMFPKSQGGQQRGADGRFTSGGGDGFLGGGGLSDLLGGGKDDESSGSQKEIIDELKAIREAIEQLAEKMGVTPRSHPESPGQPGKAPGGGGVDMTAILNMMQKGTAGGNSSKDMMAAVEMAMKLAAMAAV